MFNEILTRSNMILFILGIIAGLFAGIAIYWLPLGQNCNEWKALLNLVKKRYGDHEQISVKNGATLKSYTNPLITRDLYQRTIMYVKHDEGVNWFYHRSRWVRARTLLVLENLDDTSTTIYRMCHLDIE